MGLYKSKDAQRQFVHVKRDDTVVVISGDDKGKRGKVIAVSPAEGKVIVEKVNIVSKHVKPRRQGQQGGIIKTEGAIYASKVMPYCSKCNKGVRIKHRVSPEGAKTRECASCGAEI